MYYFKQEDDISTIVKLDGKFDFPIVEKFRDEFLEKMEEGIVSWTLNLEEVSFIDSMALGILVAMQASLEKRGGKMKLMVRDNEKIYSLFEITKLNRVFKIF